MEVQEAKFKVKYNEFRTNRTELTYDKVIFDKCFYANNLTEIQERIFELVTEKGLARYGFKTYMRVVEYKEYVFGE